MRLTIKNVSYPLIDTLVSQLCFDGDSGVKCRLQPQTEISGVGFLRSTTELGVSVKIISNRLFKCSSKLMY